MADANHHKILALGFAGFAAIYLLTFLILVLVTAGVFVGLGITFANETGDNTNAGIGILGAVFSVVFYTILGLIFVLPPAVAGWKLWKGKRTRAWVVLASLAVLPILPLGTVLGIYGLWFVFSFAKIPQPAT